MTARITAIALLLGLSSSAEAGGYLAGSLHASPTQTASLAVGLPTFRVGAGNGSFAAFGGLSGGRVDLGDDAELVAWGLQPMFGVRGRLGKEATTATVRPLLTGGVYTRIFGLSSDDPRDEVPEQDEGSLRPVVGGLAGTGLDVRLGPHLSLAVEVGVDAFTAGYQYDGWVNHGDLFSTWSAVTVNIWL